MLFRDDKTGAVDLSIDPKNPNVLFAALWEAIAALHVGHVERRPRQRPVQVHRRRRRPGPRSPRTPGCPRACGARCGVSVSPVDGNRVYALIENEDGGLFVSDDAGAHLEADQRQPQPPPARVLLHAPLRRPEGQGHGLRPERPVLQVDRRRQDLTTRSACRTATTTTCGSRRATTKRMIAGQRRRRQRHGQRRQTWTDQDYPTGQFYNVFTTKHVPYHVCGAQQDNSTACCRARRTGGAGEGSLPPIFYAVGGGESGYIAPDPLNAERLLRRQLRRPLTRLDRRPGSSAPSTSTRTTRWATRSDRHQRALPVDVPDRLLADRPEDALRLVAAPVEDDQRRAELGADQPRPDARTIRRRCSASGGPITKDQTGVETYAVIFTIAPSRQDVNTIWTGSDDGFVHVTRDGGKTWENVTPKDLPEFARISLIEASPHQNGAAYVAATATSCDDRKPYVYKTTDFGKTWTKIVTGIPDTRLRAHRSARIPSARACSTSAPSTASTCRSTTAPAGSRCS